MRVAGAGPGVGALLVLGVLWHWLVHDVAVGDGGDVRGRSRLALAGLVVLVVLVVVGVGVVLARAMDGDGRVRTAGTTTTTTTVADDALSSLLVSCGGPAYPRQALQSREGVERDQDAAAAGLRALIANPDGIGPIPKTGWRRLYDEGGRAVFSNGEFGDDFYEVELRKDGDAYEFGGSSMGCRRASVDVGDRSLASFRLADGGALTPQTTSFTVSVTEGACTGAQPIGRRLAEPEIEYGTDTVGLLFTADPLPSGSYTCPGNPSQEATVHLEEPLGSRRVVDLSSYPPRDPTTED